MATVDLANSSVPGGSRGLRAYAARPEGEGPWPGVVALHEVWGVDDVLRRQVDHLARLGYLTIAPDLYADGGGLRCVASVFGAMTRGRGRAFADIEAARAWLVDSPDCTGRTGVVGFCLGGGFALVLAGRAAAGEGFDVAAPNYGHLPRDLSTLRQACPIVASYGAKDRSLPGAAARLEEALTEFGVDHDVVEYPTAGHSFLNDAPNGPRPLRPFARVLGVGPDPEAAGHAWSRIDAFFGRHLIEE